MADGIAMPIRFEIDKGAPLVTRVLQTLLMEGDDSANEIVVALTDGNEPVALDGYAASAEMQRGDGNKVPCECSISGNVVTAKLNAHCYAVPGRYTLNLRLTHAGTGMKRTILRISGRVEGEGDGALVNIEDYIISIDDLLAEVAAMREATAEAREAAEAAATAADRVEKIVLNSELIYSFTEEAGEAARQAKAEMDEAKEAAEDALHATQGWGNVTASVTPMITGSMPYVTLTGDASGRHFAFGLPDAYTPQRGKDYWTSQDIEEIQSYVDDAILGGKW